MARGDFIRGLGLVALLFSVAFSTPDQQNQSAPRSGLVEPESEEKADDEKTALGPLIEPNQPLRHFPTPASYYSTPPSPRIEQCVYADQRIYAVDEWGQCQVCICVQRYSPYILEPVCGSCNQCGNNYPTENPIPTPPPTPPPPPPPPPIPTCDPLPTNKYYPNPIDPCQICICRQSEDIFGLLEPPVIECQANPQCVTPTTRPSPPPGPPSPLPICNYYPQNVWFPHPQFSCYLCKCDGPSLVNPRPTIECYTDPICEPTPSPYPYTTTVAPPVPPPPPPPIPIPFPQPVDPLPGPSPHSSCRPFSPNQPFQHPWDVCLECVCTEAVFGEFINVQVNCFTKPECCVVPSAPAYYPGVIGSANANAVAEASGEAYGSANAIVNAEAAAQAAAQAHAAAEQAVQTNSVNHYLYQQPGQIDSAASQALANALAQAQAIQAQGQAQAQAQAQALASAEANAASQGQLTNYNNYPVAFEPTGGYVNGFPQSNIYPPSGPYLGSGIYSTPSNYFYPRSNPLVTTAQADASAQSELGLFPLQGNANGQGGIGTALDQVNPKALREQSYAQAQANAQSNAVPYQYLNPPGASYYGNPNGYSTAQALAKAIAQGQGTAQSQAEALAQGLAQAQAGAQNNVSPYGSPQPNPYYYGGASSYSNAKAQSDAQTGQAVAHALANASSQKLSGQASAQANAASYQGQPSYYNLEPLRVKSGIENKSDESAERGVVEAQDAAAQRSVAKAQADALAQIVGAQPAIKAAIAEGDSSFAQPAAVGTLKSASPEQ